MARRIISRTRTGRTEPLGRRRRPGFSTRYDQDYDRDYDRDLDRSERIRESRASGPAKKASPLVIIIIILLFGGCIGGALWYSSKSTEDARQAGPDAVTKNVVAALGTNSLTTANKYVAEGDTSTKTQLSSLFENYADYFAYEDDYIKWEDTTYSITAQNDTSATVEVSGTAVIVQVDYVETWDDFEEDYVEEKVESTDEEHDFSQATFKLKKVGEEWFLDSVPTTIF